MMRSILVTGGSGFIGSHISLKLLENGFDVYIADSFLRSSSYMIKNIKYYIKNRFPDANNRLHFFEGDIRDYDFLNKIFSFANLNSKNIEAVIHLAGLKSVSESVKKPLLYWDNNLCGAINLLRVMAQNDCKTIVFSSSAAIYDPYDSNKIVEETRINPINPYGQTKAAIEILLKDIYKSDPKNWRVANLRYFNPLGAHKSGLIGEEVLSDASNLFPNIIKVALKIKKEVYIYGNNWDTFDGTCIRDYIHVMDLAEGHIRTLEYLLSKRNKYLNLNLGTGEGKSVLEVIKTFEDINKVKIPFVYKDRREGDREKIIANISFSKKVLNWSPVLNLEDMCIDSWRWINSKNKN